MVYLSPAPAGTLRERFIADMTVRGFTDKTRKDVTAQVFQRGQAMRRSSIKRSG